MLNLVCTERFRWSEYWLIEKIKQRKGRLSYVVSVLYVANDTESHKLKIPILKLKCEDSSYTTLPQILFTDRFVIVIGFQFVSSIYQYV